jgi:predicted transcriptional regulator
VSPEITEEERLSDLYFQLSSADRRRIVDELQKESLKLNEVAKKLDLTATEASRQLQRLTDTGFLERTPDGKYRATSYAHLILASSIPLDFISKHREYFMNHDISRYLPPEFQERIGELSCAVMIPTTMDTFNHVAEMLSNAKERIDVTIEIGSKPHLQIMRESAGKGVEVRWLIQESFLPKIESMFSGVEKIPEIRSIPKLLVHVYLTETAATIAFRHIDGKMTYESFVGEDASFLKWASDLFGYQWKSAKPWNP